MVQSNEITLELFASGYCDSHANVVDPKNGKGKSKFYAVWALIHLPDVGYILFDTGYSNAFLEATQPFPERFYRWITPITLSSSDTAKAILHKKEIATDDIAYVVISHFHGDHIAALRDFNKATFICSATALDEVYTLSRLKAVSKGILHSLLPPDFSERVKTVEEMAHDTSQTPEGLTTYNIFNTPVFQLVDLPGHARGMLGFLFSHLNKHIFYGTDASWSYDTYAQQILPRKLVKLFFDSWHDFVTTQNMIRAFEKRNPQFTVLFTHCPKTLQYIGNAI